MAQILLQLFDGEDNIFTKLVKDFLIKTN